MAKNTSFIRWAGGKGWFISAVQEMIQNIQFNNYIEPFMGGASIFFALDIPHIAYLSDINGELVNTFIQIRDNLDKVTQKLREYKTDKESYYVIRNQEPTDLIEKAARFLYLNFYSFNGIYRVNSQGKFNVPYGRRSGAFNYDRLEGIREKLQVADIRQRDFFDCRDVIHAGDLVFLDPPYAVASKSSDNNMFIAYNQNLFSLADQQRLAEMIDYIEAVGAYFILTNAHHEEIARIFEGRGERFEFDRTCNIGGKAAKRGKVQEYIFTNIPGVGGMEAEE
jgi:DNA adenine methylase